MELVEVFFCAWRLGFFQKAVMSEKKKKLVAYHEAGHAILGALDFEKWMSFDEGLLERLRFVNGFVG